VAVFGRESCGHCKRSAFPEGLPDGETDEYVPSRMCGLRRVVYKQATPMCIPRWELRPPRMEERSRRRRNHQPWLRRAAITTSRLKPPGLSTASAQSLPRTAVTCLPETVVTCCVGSASLRFPACFPMLSGQLGFPHPSGSRASWFMRSSPSSGSPDCGCGGAGGSQPPRWLEHECSLPPVPTTARQPPESYDGGRTHEPGTLGYQMDGESELGRRASGNMRNRS